jgi:hypothetical protein
MLEYTIDNPQTEYSEINHKLFLWSNPKQGAFFRPGRNIVIYTDIWTHFRMSYEKRCYWFDMKDLDCNKQTITEILGSFDQEKNYDDQMQDYKICKEFLDKNSIEWNDTRIYHKFKSEIDIDKADIVVKVQDIIKTEGKCLYEPLGLQLTEQAKQFTRDYVELHPPSLGRLLCG